MKYTNVEGHSLSVAVWLVTDDYIQNPYPGKAHLSATGLLKPERMIILSQRANAKKTTASEMDISMNIPNHLGSAMHSSIQRAWETNYKKALLDLNYPKGMVDKVRINPTPENLKVNPDIIPVYMEQRASKEICGYIIDGQYDFIGDGTLEDFKSTGVYGFMKNDAYDDQLKILQGSIYRWLNPDIITSDHMLIQYTFTDWSKLDSKIRKKKGYPQSRIVPKKFMLMPVQETESWVRQKLNTVISLQKTPEPDLPLCTAEELWRDKPVFKYYKNPDNRKRSTANFEDYHEAHARLLKDDSVGVIVDFRGKVRRCGYCDAYDLCTQKDQYIADGTIQLP